MADPTPFLSTITAASAGLVAIIGGLLVNRFIGLDSEQQGTQALLDQAEERLMVARSRAADSEQQDPSAVPNQAPSAGRGGTATRTARPVMIFIRSQEDGMVHSVRLPRTTSRSS